jgi:hypothetical protein
MDSIPHYTDLKKKGSHLKDEGCDNALRGQGYRTPQGAVIGIGF